MTLQRLDLLNKGEPIFVSFSDVNIDIVEHIHREAYPPDMRIWSRELLLNDTVKERLIGRFSFLLSSDVYIGHCLALADESFFQPESGERALFIADMAVKPELQGKGYGLLMAQEILRRAADAHLDRIEFYAREETSYLAIKQSSHIEKMLSDAGYTKSEHGRQRFSDTSPNSEYGRLIILQK